MCVLILPWSECNLVLTNSNSKTNNIKQKNQKNEQVMMNKETQTNKQET
jgi:uncharacterized protein YgiM (DUF1202 family)